ncbi:MAG: hypothetical protein NVSMB65_13650 [Chloroflexota bacterium]
MPQPATNVGAAAISGDMLIRDVVTRYPALVEVFTGYGLPCAGCHVSTWETVAGGVATHRLDVDRLLASLNAVLRGDKPDLPSGPGRGRQLNVMQKHPRPAASEPGKGTIKHVVAVMSGKGGVGKSLVTGLLAVALKREGFAVGVLDGDITGPSIPRMFGLPAGAMKQTRENEPPRSRGGVAIMSMNVLLDTEDQPVVWRGPMVANAIKQFYTDIAWGDLDYLLVDLPPGTSDAPMTTLQALPVDGVVIVSTPQLLSNMVVRKAIHMCEKLETPVIGLVENMAYLDAPGGLRLEPFGSSQAAELVGMSGAPLLAQLPIDQRIAQLCDTGMIEAYDSEPFTALRANFLKVVKGATRPALPLRTR